jgi:hypothetical protein
MDHKNAVTLLEETFEQEFDIDRYASFIKELFNHIKISIRDVPLRKEYYNYVDTVNSLGVYRDSDKRSIEVFAIKLKRTSSRDRARTMQRNLIARYLSQFNLDAALVAFYDDEPEDWRFSFVKMEYELTKNETGNIKVTEELTPARRHSFLVGKNESNHTCKIQFLGLIKEEDKDPQVAEIEEKFSVENVTKEFFTAYKKLFLDLKESLEEMINTDPLIKNEFKEKNILTTDFAKKLLGQIVFIYFLQKKGWLGVKKQESWGAGPKNFLKKLFNGEMANYDNFFNEMLEPLFYEALATERDGDYYSRFNCRIPFLNGGLFEPINDYNWIDTDITLNNEIFKEILDTFDLFNFTVKEDEPLEKEVAVDPEMLGKVFENLLEVTDRKSKGAFYTPREIVHYMCQQSLVDYLETNASNISKEDIEKFILKGDLALDSIIREQEQKKTYHGRVFQKQLLPESIKENSDMIDKLLMDIKVIDPAVGSGAFPVGMMNEIVRARHIISLLSEKEVNYYNLKRETVENSLYGVDIDSSAVDITKLRFWLSLVVDEEDIQNIKPLPNLDHKIMCGNSLIEEFEGTKLFDENLLEVPEITPELERINTKKEHLEKKLKQLREESSINIDIITEIDNQISKLRKKIKKISAKTNNKSQASLFASDAQKKLKKLKEKHTQFFNAESPNKKKKLRKDIDLIEWEFIEETLKNEGNEETILKLEEYKKNKSKPFFLWKLYFSEVFQRDNPGFDVVIANPPYVRMEQFKDVRPYFKTHYVTYAARADLYVYFYEKALNLLNNGGVLSFISSNKFTRVKYGKNLRELILNYNFKKYLDFTYLQVFEGVTVESCITLIKKEPSENNIIVNDEFEIPQDRFNSSSWTFQNPFILDLNDKITANGTEISFIDGLNVSRGITTGYNKAFLIDKTTADLLNGKKDSEDILKQILRGKDVKRWIIDYNDLYVIFIRYGSGEKIIKKFPDIYAHLNNYYEELNNRGQVKNGQHHWLELDNNVSNDFLKELEKEKIIWQRIAYRPTFCYEDDGKVILDSMAFLTSKNEKYSLKYILSIFNSNIMKWYLIQMGHVYGDRGFLVSNQYINKFPLYPANANQQEPFIKKADKLIQLNKEVTNNQNSFKIWLKREFNIDKTSKKLDKFYLLSFEDLFNELKKKKVDLKNVSNVEKIKIEFEKRINIIKPLIQEIEVNEIKLNELVYKLYDLTSEEISLIEDYINKIGG